MEFKAALEALVQKSDLGHDDAKELMAFLVSGEATDAQLGGALMALASKGATSTELAAFATVLRELAQEVQIKDPNLVDTCGTGGGTPSFNLSTAAAIVASAAGAKIAKHGNRGVTSACGSADVLEALGARIDGDPEQNLHLLETVGLAFFFAPAYHPAMKAVGKVRRELGVRTVFNQLGPLANPAGARRQVVGVFDPTLALPMGEALLKLGAERALVVHGADGLDEISPCVPTHVVKVWDRTVSEGSLSPANFGLQPVSPEALAPGSSAEENAAILREAVSDPESPRAWAILPSAAAVIWIAGLSEGIADSAVRAQEAIRSGSAASKLAQFVEASQGQ